MIKTLLKFILGFIVGSFIAFLLVYALGFALETMNISLYESESDQQRNFNIFIVISLIIAVISGYFATKISKKTNK